MSADYLVIGHFKYVDDSVSAIDALRESGFKQIDTYSPVPDHDLEAKVYEGVTRSPVRMFTMLGGLTGCLGAFLFTTWMSIDYPIRTSAKPLMSIPAFVVIAFECTILLGAIFTLLSMGHFSRVPNIRSVKGHRPNFSDGTFGISVRVPEGSKKQVKELLEKAGAKQVDEEYVR